VEPREEEEEEEEEEEGFIQNYIKIKETQHGTTEYVSL
jgi:hypothetical protein